MVFLEKILVGRFQIKNENYRWKFKGSGLKFFENKKTRPLKDSVRENIFNILIHSNEIKVGIKNTAVLDLYSGSGSFGLECLSRGAKTVSFVEFDQEAIKILNENLLKLTLQIKSEIINKKIEDIQNWKKKYNIFFQILLLKILNLLKT